LNQADLLPHLFKQIVIPPEVAAEMRHAKAPDLVRSFIAAPPSWLSIQAPAVMLPLPELDAGEAAAISLAAELGAALLIDEIEGGVSKRSRSV